MVGEVVVVHLALQSAGCIVCTLEKHDGSHFSCVFTHVDEQRDGLISFAAAVLIWFPIPCNNDLPAESSEGKLERREAS